MAAQLARWALRLLGPCRLRSCPALSFETLVTFLWYDVVTGGGSRTVGRQGPLPRVATLSLPAASSCLLRLLVQSRMRSLRRLRVVRPVLKVRTSGGGQHWYYPFPLNAQTPLGELAPGVMALGGDRRGCALHVSLPPSPTTGRYKWS